jgi:hypothetical protein
MLATEGGTTDVSGAPARTEEQVLSSWKRGTLLTTGHRLHWWRELVAVGLLYLFYESTRNLTKSGAGTAYQHALTLIDWQRTLGINIELEIQQHLIDDRWVIIASNYFYGAGYVLSTLGALVWLYRRRPDHYSFWRNTLAIGTLLGLVGFRFFPLMPPRLLDVHLGGPLYGFVDTLKQFPTLWSFDNSAMEKVSNQYAAMPSLHCGWAMWVAAATVGLVRTKLMRVVVLLLPVVTTFVVVVTANHYFLDAVGGAAIMATAYLASMFLTRAGYVPLRGWRWKDGYGPSMPAGDDRPASSAASA